jgi:phospholipase C
MLTRRRFLYGTCGALSTLAACQLSPSAATLSEGLEKSGKSAIKHIIVLMMENRSFDHYLGWLPGADGRQAGLSYFDKLGIAHATYPLAPDYQGCGHPDPDHDFANAQIEYDGGQCDGWLRTANNDEYAIGYYTRDNLPFLGEAALQWTTFDRYFSAIRSSTYPNRIYQHAGVTDRLDSSLTLCTLPTIWDRLAAKGLVGKYYFSDTPFLALWGSKYAPIMRPFDEFVSDCAAGELPQVSFVDPRFAGEDQGASGDDHPHADIRVGEYFMYQVYKAVTTSPAWRHTVLVVNFDEWGGFFEHVPPPLAPDVNPDYQQRGFRVPCLLISPFARRSYVSHAVYDHTSILKMIEWRWDLQALSVRDAKANNLADELDLSTVDLTAPDFAVPPVLVSVPCV